jgi:hypothetical protein
MSHTINKLLGFLANNPMSRINIHQLKPREKPPNNRQYLITHIVTLRAPNKQRLLPKPRFIRILKRKIRHVVQRIRQNLDRDAELERLSRRGSDEVGEQELAHRQVFGIGLQDLVCGFLGFGLGFLDALHAFCVFWEVTGQRCIDGRVVYGDDVCAAVWVAERHCHDGLCAHGVSDKRRIFETMFLQEGFDVVG